MAIPLVEKAVAEAFPIGLTYVSPDLATGETIVSVTVSVSPVGLTVATPGSISGAEVSSPISGGTAGVEYVVLFKVTTSGGKIFNNPNKDAITVRVI